MYHPKHRALVRRRFPRPPIRAAGLFALAVATALGSSAAYADRGGGPPGKGKDGHGNAVLAGLGKSPGSTKPKPKPEPGQDKDHQDDDAVVAEKLTPTAPPVTPYEMPFPCGEVWTGTTRGNHSPSVRSIDFNYPGGDLGKTVVAAAGGTVVTAVTGKKLRSYGQYVVIDHGGYESTLYAHLDSVSVVVGQVVTAGVQIGTVGATGNASGSHLHFEERYNGSDVDAWFHGALFPVNTSATSYNCGGAAVPMPVVPVMAPIPTTEVPLAGNMYGKPPAEVMVYRKVAPAAFHVTRTGKAERVITIGSTSDQPFVGDWNGDGRVNPGVRNPSTRVFYLRVRGKDTTLRFGKRADTPVAGNWDGQGPWEIGVWRGKNAKFLLRNADGTKTKVRLGTPDSLPITGDWDGDGVTDLGVFDRATATFTVRLVDAVGTETITQIPFGTPGDLPVAADWDGNGITDLGTWSPTTAVFTKRGAPEPTALAKHTKQLSWGRALAK